MRDFNPHLESGSSHSTDQPEGVSEAQSAKNEGWGHRTQIARNQHAEHKQESISKVYEERIDGELVTLSQLQREESPEQHPKDGETQESDYKFGRPLSDKEQAALKYGEHWPESKKREFLANDTTLSADQLGWNL
jgi:hypothetical protein